MATGDETCGGINACGFECFFAGEGWEDAGEGAGHECFAGTGWAEHQDVVRASGSDHEGAFDGFLTFNVCEVDFGCGGGELSFGFDFGLGCDEFNFVEVSDD